MERATGAALFERHARGVRPTTAGIALVRRAAVVIHEADSAVAEIATLRERVSGVITVGSYPTGNILLLPRAIAQLSRAHPGATVRVREGSSPDLLRQLRAGRVDLALIAYGPDLNYDITNLRQEPIVEGRTYVAVSEDHRLAGCDSVTPEDLRDELWIVGTGRSGDPQFGPWPGTENPKIAYRVKEWPARLGFVAAGLGIAVVPSAVVAVLPGHISVIPVAGSAVPRRTVLALTRRSRTSIAEAFTEQLLEVASSVRARTHVEIADEPALRRDEVNRSRETGALTDRD